MTRVAQTAAKVDATALAHAAIAGDASALDALLRNVQGDVFNLAVRMLWCPDDAADATQDILLKVATRLSTFEGQSSFRTWLFRVATNHLLDVRRSRVEREGLTFAAFRDSLETGLAEPTAGWESDPEQRLLVEEVKIGCTMGMLICLDREQRIAYVLGDVFQFRSEDAAAVLDISAAAFRKRLSRARLQLRTFMRTSCGLVSASAACRCSRRLPPALAAGRVRPHALVFAPHTDQTLPVRRAAIASEIDQMETLHEMSAVFQSQPSYPVPARVIDEVRRLLNSPRFSLLGPS